MNPPGRPRRRSRYRLRAVLLDAYGTLFHYEPARMSVLFQLIVERLNVPVDPETLLQHWRVHETAFRQSRVWLNDDGQWDAPPPDQFTPYRDAWLRAFQLASDELNLDSGYAQAAVGMIYDDLKGRGMYRDVAPALEALRARVPLAIVSNADHEYLHGTIATNGLTFDHVISSEGVRVYKPHPRIFETALAAFGIDDPSHALYVGDSPREDVLGPQNLGIPAAWLNRTAADWPTPRHSRESMPRTPIRGGNPAPFTLSVSKGEPPTPDYEITTLLALVDIVASKTLSAL